MLQNSSENFLEKNAEDQYLFWVKGKKISDFKITNLNSIDCLYSLVLLGKQKSISSASARKYAKLVSQAPIFGRMDISKKDCLRPHHSAYLLGGLNLLANIGHDYREEALEPITLDTTQLINKNTNAPLWPKHLTHHIWRVSHWIGGIPSILLTFAHYDPKKIFNESFVIKVLESCDKHIIVKNTGLMMPYESKAIQQIFRKLYQIRHDPDLADIGGLAHIHWINYVTTRNYIANTQLIKKCEKDLINNTPFFEESPYCLDFDYVQLLRTAIERDSAFNKERLHTQLKKYSKDIVSFLSNIPSNGYSVHKVPGALATLHEIALLLELDTVSGINCPPIDIIKQAYWL